MENKPIPWGITPGLATSSEPDRALSAAPERNYQLVKTLIAHSSTLKAQYEQSWLLEDVEGRIRAIRNALAMLLDGLDSTATHVDPPTRWASGEEPQLVFKCMYALSEALGDRYKHTGQPADLDEQVQLLQRASGIISDDTALATSVQSKLGAVLRSRFTHAGVAQDILEAFKLHSALLDRHFEPGPDRARLVCDLGCTLFIRHHRFGVEDDIPRSIELLDEALQHFSKPHPRRFMAQYFLAMASWMQYRLNGDSSRLHAAIALYRDMLRSQPSNYPDRWLAYNGLSSSMVYLHNQTNDIGHLNEAVECANRAFNMQSLENPNRVRAAINLASMLTARYTLLGHLDDLDESIRVSQMCLKLSHGMRPVAIQVLAETLLQRYEAFGAADDLDEGIRMLREIRDEYPEGHPLRVRRLHRLADALLMRYIRDKLVDDLTCAISLFRETVSPSLSEGGDHAGCFAWALSLYHEDYVDVQYLEEAILLCETLSQNQAASQHIHGLLLRRYAKVLRLRYEFYHELDDLNLAILRYEEALDYHTAGHTLRPRSLIELSQVLLYRFEALHNTQDVDKAKELLVNALMDLPGGDTGRSLCLFQLARLHVAQASPLFSLTEAFKNTKQAMIDGYQNAQTRVTNVLELLKHIESHRPLFVHDSKLQHALLDVYNLTIDLLPQVAYFALDVPSRLRVLSNSDQLAVDGAIQALLVNEPKVAIQLLEQGRAVFWSQHLRLRTAFDALPVQLAAKLSRVAAKLERGSYVDEMAELGHNDRTKIVQENEAAKHRRLGDEFEALIAQARAQPGFERFMLPDAFQVLGLAASRGPVVVLLANQVTCQAVVIANVDNIYQIDLLDVSWQKLQNFGRVMTRAARNGRNTLRERAVKVRTGLKDKQRAEDLLEVLWLKVIQKVMDALQSKKSQGRSRPRVTLCPTGVFAHLPIHAAGIYDRSDPEATECFSDYLVPSYTPTIGVLLHARRQLPQPRTSEATMLLAAVSRPPKWTPLPFVVDEVALVRAAVPSHVPIHFLGDVECIGLKPLAVPTTSAVLEKLPEATVLHLACHGYQDPENPLESGFMMQDGMLTVAKLMSLKLDKAFLAFLSACETAKGDRTQPDQAIHLAATMLFAGFKSVVGTMWAMDDVDGPVIAQTIYEELFRTGVDVLDPDSIPYALDDAVRKLRAKGLAASRWAPYVHLGV